MDTCIPEKGIFYVLAVFVLTYVAQDLRLDRTPGLIVVGIGAAIVLGLVLSHDPMYGSQEASFCEHFGTRLR